MHDWELTSPPFWGRRLQLIDCQNIFCEVDKYTRVSNPEIAGLFKRTRIKRRFSPNPEKLDVWFPPKWKLNQKISEWISGRRVEELDFTEFQDLAKNTDLHPKGEDSSEASIAMLIPFLAWPAKSVSSKRIQEAPSGRRSLTTLHCRVGEELGDLLWYISNVATKFDLSLDAIARGNLIRPGGAGIRPSGALFDEGFPPEEQFPRVMEVELATRRRREILHVRRWYADRRRPY